MRTKAEEDFERRCRRAENQKWLVVLGLLAVSLLIPALVVLAYS